MSEKYIPPWCESGRTHKRRQPRKVSHHDSSSWCVQEHVRPYNDGVYTKIGSTGYLWKTLIFLTFIIGVTISYTAYKEIPIKAVTKLVSKTNPLIWVYPKTPSVDEECCRRLGYLTSQLARAQHLLRAALRTRKTRQKQPQDTAARKPIGSYIAGARAVKGSNTTEWGGQLALWGVVPLWRASPPPDTILALRKPARSDCWPFSGSTGDVIIHLPQPSRVDTLSLEHIQPDTAFSAPKQFIVYGILENGTWIKGTDGMYRYNKPAKQYYSLHKSAPLKSIVFRVLSNYGNPQYTCIYRLHLYTY